MSVQTKIPLNTTNGRPVVSNLESSSQIRPTVAENETFKIPRDFWGTRVKDQ